VNSGLTLEPIVVKNRKRPSDAYLNRLETLKEWRKNAAARMGVQSDIILPRDILEAIVGSNPQNQSDLRLEMADVPWRYSRFGAEILEVIHQDGSQ
jgi:ribonuclease D